MSSTNSYSPGPPNQKRFRSDPLNDPKCPEDCQNYPKDLKYSTSDIFEPFETRKFDVLKQRDHCVVEGRDSGGRHLFSSPPYATAAVTNSSDTELLSNGDSGFQELNIPDELTISEKMGMKNNKIDNNDETSSVCETDTEQRNDSSNSLINQSTSKDSNDEEDSISEFSYASDISNMSGENWKPINNNIEWVQRQIENGSDPKAILAHLTGGEIMSDINDIYAWHIIIRLLSEPSRKKLDNINNIDDVIRLIEKSNKIIVLTGAGVSVSCGIPDFRSRNGIYARLSKDYPDLPDPQSMFDIRYFKRNPYPFFKFAKEIYPGQFQPSASHKFIKYLETKGKLLRNYSQNIDTLEKTAGIENVITCHGSFATATCTICRYKVDSNAIKSEIFAQKIPLCSKCTTNHENDDGDDRLPVMKPDIVFFGEGLSDEFHNSMTIDKDQCDLLIVIGSSLKVRPVALIPSSIPENIPQILINREPLNHCNFDVELLGDCDVIVKHLCKRLGNDWLDFCFADNVDSMSNESNEYGDDTATSPNNENDQNYQFIPPSRYIFKGAELNEDGSSNNDSDDYDSDSVDDDAINNHEPMNECNTTANINNMIDHLNDDHMTGDFSEDTPIVNDGLPSNKINNFSTKMVNNGQLTANNDNEFNENHCFQ